MRVAVREVQDAVGYEGGGSVGSQVTKPNRNLAVRLIAGEGKPYRRSADDIAVRFTGNSIEAGRPFVVWCLLLIGCV